VATRYRFRAHGYHGAMDAPGTSERARPHGAGRAQAGNGAGAVGPGRRLSADARRRQLFEVALALFAEHGYPSTTMDDIAEAAGVTKPLVYQHFDSKRALYLELMDVFSGELVTRIVKATATAEGPRQQVELGFAAYFELMVDNEQAFRLLYGRDAPDDPELGAALRRVEEVIAEAIDPLIDAGLDPAHRLLLAHAVVGMAEGASRHWLEARKQAPAGGDPELLPADPAEEAAVLAAQLADFAWAGLRQIHRL
jgi:AcrR family transcriptional regulator